MLEGGDRIGSKRKESESDFNSFPSSFASHTHNLVRSRPSLGLRQETTCEPTQQNGVSSRRRKRRRKRDVEREEADEWL